MKKLNLKGIRVRSGKLLTYGILGIALCITSCQKDELVDTTAEDIQKPIEDELQQKVSVSSAQLFAGYYCDPSFNSDPKLVQSMVTYNPEVDVLNLVKEHRQTRVSYKYSFISTEESLEDHFALSTATTLEGNANFVYGKLDVQAQLETDLKRQFNSNSKQVFLLVEARVSGIKRNIDLFRASFNMRSGTNSPANKLNNLTDYNKKQFQKLHGNGWISEIEKGASFVLVYRFDYSDSKTFSSTDVTASLQASFSSLGRGSVTAKQELSTSSSKELTKNNVKIDVNVYSESGFNANAELTPEVAVNSFSKSFIEEVKSRNFESLQTIGVRVENYENLAGYVTNYQFNQTHNQFFNTLTSDFNKHSKVRNDLLALNNKKSEVLSFLDTYSLSIDNVVKNKIASEFNKDENRIKKGQQTYYTTQSYSGSWSSRMSSKYYYYLLSDNSLNKWMYLKSKYNNKTLARVEGDRCGSSTYNGHTNMEWKITVNNKLKNVNGYPLYKLENKRERNHFLTETRFNGRNDAHTLPKTNNNNQLWAVKRHPYDKTQFALNSIKRQADGIAKYLRINTAGSDIDYTNSRYNKSYWTIHQEDK